MTKTLIVIFLLGTGVFAQQNSQLEKLRTVKNSAGSFIFPEKLRDAMQSAQQSAVDYRADLERWRLAAKNGFVGRERVALLEWSASKERAAAFSAAVAAAQTAAVTLATQEEYGAYRAWEKELRRELKRKSR